MADIIDGLKNMSREELLVLNAEMETYTLWNRVKVFGRQIREVFRKIVKKDTKKENMGNYAKYLKVQLEQLEEIDLMKKTQMNIVKKIQKLRFFSSKSTKDQIAVTCVMQVAAHFGKRRYRLMSPAEIADDVKVRCEKQNQRNYCRIPEVWLWLSVAAVFFTPLLYFFARETLDIGCLVIWAAIEGILGWYMRRKLAISWLKRVIVLSGVAYGTSFAVQASEANINGWTKQEQKLFAAGLGALHTIQEDCNRVQDSRQRLLELNEKSRILLEKNKAAIETRKEALRKSGITYSEEKGVEGSTALSTMEQKENIQKIKALEEQNSDIMGESALRNETIEEAQERIIYWEGIAGQLFQILLDRLQEEWRKEYEQFAFHPDFFRQIIQGFEFSSLEIIEKRLRELARMKDAAVMGKKDGGIRILKFPVQGIRCDIQYTVDKKRKFRKKTGPSKIKILAVVRSFPPIDAGMSNQMLLETLEQFGITIGQDEKKNFEKPFQNAKDMDEPSIEQIIQQNPKIIQQEEEIEKTRELLEKMSRQMEQGEKKIQQLMEETQELFLEKQTLEMEKLSLNQEKDSLQKQKDTLIKQLEQLKENSENHEAEEKRLHSEIAKLQDKIENLQKQVAEKMQRLSEVDEKHNETSRYAEELIKRVKKDNEKLQETMEELRQQTEDLKEEKQRLLEQNQTLEEQNELYTKRTEALLAEKQQLLDEKQQVEREREELQLAHEKLQQEIGQNKDTISELEEKNQKLKEECNSLTVQMQCAEMVVDKASSLVQGQKNEDLNTSIDKVQLSKEALESMVKEKQIEIILNKKKCSELQKQNEEIQKQIEAAEKEKKRKEQENEKQRKEVERKLQGIRIKEERIQHQKQELAEKKKELQKQGKLFAKQEKELEGKAQKVASREKELEGKAQEVTSREKELEGKAQEISRKEKELSELLGNYEALKNPVSEARILENEEIKKLFDRSFEEAEKEVCIMSPWIGRFTLQRDFIERMQNACNRGVTIKICYGFRDDRHEGMDISKRTFDIIVRQDRGDTKDEWSILNIHKMHQKMQKNAPGRLVTNRQDSHGKMLIVDNKYYAIGSFNFLSYDGSEKGRGEVCQIDTNPKMIARLKEKFFSFEENNPTWIE